MLRKFLKNKNGNVAMMFALVIGPMILAAGVSVDVLRMNQGKQVIKAATDAATMAAARAASDNPDISEDELRRIAINAYETIVEDAPNITTVSTDFSSQDGSYGLEAVATIKTSFLSIAGHDTLNVGKTSVANLQTTGALELVMVLDTTGSMYGQKLIDLKAAAQSLVDELLQGGATNVNISVVPFAEYVNVGIANRGQPWLEVEDDYTSSATSCVTTYPNQVITNCNSQTTICISDAVSTRCETSSCSITQGAPVEVCTDSVDYEWHGCVGSRSYPDNINDEDYTTRIPGIMNTECTTPITALTNDQTILSNAINDLEAYGNTYIPGGLAWGWRALSEGAPFDEGRSLSSLRSDDGEKVIVLMTDGMNTLVPTYPEHEVGSASEANDITEELCDKIKDEEIQIYTIAFQVNDTSTQDMLQRCASDEKNYFEPENADALAQSFQGIAAQAAPIFYSR